MDIQTLLTQLITAYFMSLAFGILFNVRKELLTTCALGGLLSWAGYLVAASFTSNVFLANFYAASIGALYAELFARIRKVPSTLFFLISVVPLVPGSTLYYAMREVVGGKMEHAAVLGEKALECALGIGVGLSMAMGLMDLSRKVIHRQKQQPPR